MTTFDGPEPSPLWLAIEKKISTLGSHDLAEDNLEKAVRQVAGSLDGDGYSVSGNAGHMLALRSAIGNRVRVGRPLMEDLNKALDSLTLDDLGSPYAATLSLVNRVGQDWPALKDSERRPHLLQMVEGIRLNLLVAKAEKLEGDAGVRLLIGEELPSETIIDRMGITPEEFASVTAALEAERAERARVAELLAGVASRTELEKVRHLINHDVSADLIMEMAGVDQGEIEGVKKAMEEEIAEKERLAEEAAARKAAEAAGPALEDIPPDEMLEHIEAIREILDFSDVEKEIRVMCEQSGIPKDLIEIALSEPDRLDELEAAAEG